MSFAFRLLGGATLLIVAACGGRAELSTDANPESSGGASTGASSGSGGGGSGGQEGTGGASGGRSGDGSPSPLNYPMTCAEANEQRATIGCEFSIVSPSPPDLSEADLTTVIWNGGDETAQFVFLTNDGGQISGEVPPGESHRFPLRRPFASDAQAGVHAGVAIRLTTTAPVEVMQVWTVEGRFVADGSLLLPVAASVPVVVLPDLRSGSEHPETTTYLVTAAKDNTEVELFAAESCNTPQGAGCFNGGQTIQAPGEIETYTLNQGDTIRLESLADADGRSANPAGSLIEATQPIQVLATRVLHTEDGWSHAEEVVPPALTWGKEYIALPPADREGKPLYSLVHISAFPTRPAVVTTNGATADLAGGQTLSLLAEEPVVIESDQSVSVMLSSITTVCDPTCREVSALTRLTTAEQFERAYLLPTPFSGETVFVDAAFQEGGAVFFNESPLNGPPKPIGGEGWSSYRTIVEPFEANLHSSDLYLTAQYSTFQESSFLMIPSGSRMDLITEPVPIPH